ncbi:MAG: hypothetical protein EHM87_22550 [Burkholderiales bacterium]|nr:MAG: hypothetical protein EHM87_22550 [Burkholderiales bacterium]
MSGPARPWYQACLAAALLSLAPHARAEPDPGWTEQRGLLSASRSWISPEHVEGLRATPLAGAEVRIDWTARPGQDDGVTQAERDALMDATALALLPVSAQPVRPSSTGTSRAEAGPRYRIEARITEVWRPNRLVNVVLAAMPWPLAPLFSQGGASAEMQLVPVDDDTQPVAHFECRRHAGVLQFYNAFWRIEHTRAALTDCARDFHAALRHPAAAAPGGPAQGGMATLAAAQRTPN